jgi:tRNA pseudouridine55 synthase
MKQTTMQVYDIKLINYNHPFITFEATVSEGAYIRSLAQLLVEKLNSIGTLSSLRRLNEGKFIYENEKELDPLNFLNIKKNIYTGDQSWVDLGKKIDINYLEYKDDGEYLLVFDKFFTIIKIEDQIVKYILNKIQRVQNV